MQLLKSLQKQASGLQLRG